jgi:hypothetical protein
MRIIEIIEIIEIIGIIEPLILLNSYRVVHIRVNRHPPSPASMPNIIAALLLTLTPHVVSGIHPDQLTVTPAPRCSVVQIFHPHPHRSATPRHSGECHIHRSIRYPDQ